MMLHRICSKEHTHDLSGTGAMLFGGRWNKKGTRIIYTSGTLSLAALEIIANLSSDKMGRSLFCVEIHFPDDLPLTTLDKLPKNWNSYPYSGETAIAGTNFIKSKGLCLKVPSAIIPPESNYLLNPLHESFDKIEIIDAGPLLLDKRLLEKELK